MCGYEGDVKEAIIEGSILSVCDKCITYGKVIPLDHPAGKLLPTQFKPQQRAREPLPDIIVEDCASLVKKARELLGLTQEQLAKRLQEKESSLQKVETNQLTPSLRLARKLERHLNIRLVETYRYKPDSSVKLDDADLTIGDLLNIKKRK